MVGVALGAGRQHFDLHTEHRHEASHTWSDIDVKVALTGRARSAYTGLSRIDESASSSEAYQEERNLLLSPRCRADAIPELEILNNEVRCTHGATTSPIEPEQLHYLRSRGLDAGQAQRLVVRGFFESLLRALPQGVGQRLEEQVERRLDHLLKGAGR
jgi:Fe-S cluster assembly protein SufD